MYAEAIEKYGVLAAARKSTLINQEDMATILACSVPKMVEIEKDPSLITLGQLGKYYEVVGTDGKEMIKQYVTALFLP